MDFFTDLGALGLGSRLKRLSDRCMSEARAVYEAAGVDFEPRWFPVCFLLRGRGEITVMDAAAMLELPHPYVSQLVKELQQAGLVEFRRNPNDGRSRLLTLSSKGNALITELEPLWNDIREALDRILQRVDPDFLGVVERLERSLSETPFSKLVHEKRKARLTQEIRIVEYSPELREAFEKLNREWVEKDFTVEPEDIKYFSDPEGEIIAKGGTIIFAELHGDLIGTGSLIYEDGVFELAKMAVTPAARGRGVGELIARELIRRVQAKGHRRLILVTNSKLIPAITLYKKLGFKEILQAQRSKYARGDVAMELQL
jgi:DNA-binding MarR family transcriptional regulator